MQIQVFEPGQFETERHFYPRTQNAQIHPLVLGFMRMSLERILLRYCHLHPGVDPKVLEQVLTTEPRQLRWSGSDILNVSSAGGTKHKLVVETNSCPSGQKSFPLLDEDLEEGGYGRVLKHTFLPHIKTSLRKAEPDDILAVLYDKNEIESSGYAQVLANLTERRTYLIPVPASDPERHIAVRDRWLFAKLPEGERRVACAWRYVTQKPWTRLPLNLKTPILNPVVACLAGGRNKSTAAKAFEMANGELRASGLEIESPETYTNVNREQVPLLVAQLGGKAVVKIPYLNAGQGIFTIVNQEELDLFMESASDYDEFVVQQLVGNFRWSSTSRRGKLFHIGTVPNSKGQIYAFDLRMMISWQEDQYRPIAMYARRAPQALERELGPKTSSWSVLGTNLSRKVSEDTWTTEPNRLLMMDRKDFGKLGLGIDDLIDAYIQAVLAHRAIDNLAQQLVKRGGGFRTELFRSLNNDASLLREIRVDGPTRTKNPGGQEESQSHA
ncbi:MAG: hypothetical protein P1V81_04195 [Planctomycetota bacterium]|nr:hypothetical protein [Planctomycetota bacterium]